MHCGDYIIVDYSTKKAAHFPLHDRIRFFHLGFRVAKPESPVLYAVPILSIAYLTSLHVNYMVDLVSYVYKSKVATLT